MMCRALTGRAVAGAAHPPLRLLAAGEPTQPCVRHLSWYHFLLFVQFQLRAAALLPFCFPSKALQLMCTPGPSLLPRGYPGSLVWAEGTGTGSLRLLYNYASMPGSLPTSCLYQKNFSSTASWVSVSPRAGTLGWFRIAPATLKAVCLCWAAQSRACPAPEAAAGHLSHSDLKCFKEGFNPAPCSC